MANSFPIESTVRGHHVYKRRWTPAIGEELNVLAEAGNIHDRFAVAVYRRLDSGASSKRDSANLLVFLKRELRVENDDVFRGPRAHTKGGWAARMWLPLCNMAAKFKSGRACL